MSGTELCTPQAKARTSSPARRSLTQGLFDPLFTECSGQDPMASPLQLGCPTRGVTLDSQPPLARARMLSSALALVLSLSCLLARLLACSLALSLFCSRSLALFAPVSFTVSCTAGERHAPPLPPSLSHTRRSFMMAGCIGSCTAWQPSGAPKQGIIHPIRDALSGSGDMNPAPPRHFGG
eukprot:1576899-Rhodomonas_salina.1